MARSIPRVVRSLAFVSAFQATPALAKNLPLTTDQVQVAALFDKAVREEASLQGLSRLPWTSGSSIWRPELIESIRTCKPAHSIRYGNKLHLVWDEVLDPTNASRLCSYFAILELRKGRIKRVTFGEFEIVVT